MEEEFIEGLIKFVSYDTSFNCKIKLMIKNEDYLIETKLGKFKMQMHLIEDIPMRLKGTINEKSKKIENPHDIWVKLK